MLILGGSRGRLRAWAPIRAAGRWLVRLFDRGRSQWLFCGLPRDIST